MRKLSRFGDFGFEVSRISVCRLRVGQGRTPSGLGKFWITKTFATSLGRLQGSRCPGADDFALVLVDRRQDVDGQLVRVWVIDRDELQAGIHQRRDERQITGQAIELAMTSLAF